MNIIDAFNVASEPTCALFHHAWDMQEGEDVIRVECNISYSGAWPPVMTWRRSDGGLIKDGLHTTTHPSNDTMSSSLLLNFTSDLYGVRIICTTQFEVISHGPKFATNVPGTTFVWETPVLTRKCEFRLALCNALRRFEIEFIVF